MFPTMLLFFLQLFWFECVLWLWMDRQPRLVPCFELSLSAAVAALLSHGEVLLDIYEDALVPEVFSLRQIFWFCNLSLQLK